MKENNTTVNNLKLDIKVISKKDNQEYTLDDILFRTQLNLDRIESLEKKIDDITFFLNNPKKLCYE